MKKHIAEDLPARKFPQASLSGGGDKERQGGGDSGGESKTPEKRVRQAVYDIKYRARRENIPLRSAYTQYMQNSSMSEQEKSMVREKLFGKGGIVKENYFCDISELASNSVANALYNVFIEKKNEIIDYDQLKNELEEATHFNKYGSGDKKYKVRVTDKNGTSYVRFATREKINSLRANPNIESVEMTEYGQPYEGEARGGKQTAAAKAGKDYDGDGTVESGAKEYRGAVHNAIQRKKGGVPDGKDTSSVKEEFLGELNDEKTIDVKGKKKPNKIVVHYKDNDDDVSEGAYSKFLNLLHERKMKPEERRKEKTLKTKYDDSGMKASMIDQYGREKGEQVYFATIRKQAMKEENCDNDKKDSEDSRSIPTKVNLVKNKLRAMGLKMDYEPEGEQIDEMGPLAGLAVRGALAAGTAIAGKAVHDKAKGVANKLQKKNQQTQKAIDSLKNSYEPEGEVIDERRREDEGKPRKPRDRAVEFVRSKNKEGMMTRSGKTIAQHEAERGVPERNRPKKEEETTADRLAARKQREAAAKASAQRAREDEDRRRRLA